MKIGGLGPVEGFNRFDQTKTDKATDVKTSATSASSSALSASKPASVSQTNNSKRAVRSSSVSKENTKDFSTVLGEVEKTPASSAEDKDSNVESNQENLAGATAVASQGARQPSRPTPVSDDKSAADTTTVERTSQQAAIADQKKAATNAEGTMPVEDRVSAIAETLTETVDTELSMRHLSMRDFLTKMKDEFGVEPKAVVQAFAKLDQSALMAPPEQTAEAVLSQLNLKPEQMPKAERFYREMLNQTGESALNETLVGVGAGITLNVLSEQDVAMDRLQKSILGLNDAFARRDAAIAPDVSGTANGAESATIPGLTLASLAAQSEPAMIAPPTVMMDTSDADVEVKSTEGEPKEKTEKTGESKFASLGAALSAATAGLAGASAGNAGGSSQNGSEGKSKSETSKPREFNSIESALASAGFEVPPAGEKSAVPFAAGTSTSAAMAANLASQNSDGTTTTNAQDLVRHAQILMKNGGGEMKMQLKPEGVGDVTLKVQVKDGQVAIQMLTENDSAKKLLESGLDDLKTSLAQHKLHVDALKIEVGGEMAKQRFEQAQQDSSREQARQMAQDFMGQFRQDREGFRSGFFDQSGFKNYQQPKRNATPDLEPVVTSSVSNKSNSGERRLNLVA